VRPFSGVQVLVIAFAAAGATAASEPGRPLRPVPLAWPGELAFEQYQCVANDSRGNVWLFRGDGWLVYPVDEQGLPGKPVALQTSEPVSEVREAALDSSGSQWVLLAGKPRLFRDFKEAPLEKPSSLPFAVGFLAENPLVGLWPIVLGQGQGTERGGPLPWLAAWDGRQWQVLAVHGKRHRSTGDPGADSFELPQVAFVARPKGVIVAMRYEHRFQEVDERGRVRWSVAVGEGPPKPSEETRTQAQAALQQQLEKQGVDTKRARFLLASSLPMVVRGISVRADGVVFLVVAEQGGSKLYLERWDPVAGKLSRVGLELEYQGKLTLACGRKGLFLAGHRGNLGRWFVPWEMLEQASWEAVAAAVQSGGRIGE